MTNTNSGILLEIGEFFGEYIRRDGSTSGFYSSALELAKNDNRKISTVELVAEQRSNPFFDGEIVTNFRWDRFYDWQKKIIQILSNKNDVYVVAPPGGGKTTPLMGYWLINLFMGGTNADASTLEANKLLTENCPTNIIKLWADVFSSVLIQRKINKQNASKVLFITPIRVLAFEQAEAFHTFLLDLLIFFKTLIDQSIIASNLSSYRQVLKTGRLNPISQLVKLVFDEIPDEIAAELLTGGREFENWLLNFTRKLICVKTGGGSGEYNSDPRNAIIVIATYGSAKNFIKKIADSVDFIVYDEAHLYQPSEYGGEKSQTNEITAASDAYDIIDAVSKNKKAQVAFLSGTINKSSAENFANYVNKKFGRKIEVSATAPGDPQAINKTQLRVIPDDSIRQDNELVSNIVRWVTRDEPGNAIILFSKAKIEKLVSLSKTKLAAANLQSISDRKPVNRVKEQKIKEYSEALKFMYDQNSKEYKDELRKFERKNFPENQNETIERIKNKPGADRIENKELRDAVSYGIGYIYRLDDDAMSAEDRQLGKKGISENDKIIVANLFSSGKIPVLIATPSIGIGVNVSIRNMYIPSVYKTEGTGKDFTTTRVLNNKREMAQLLNRAGRGKTPISGIYTPNEFVPYIKEIASMGSGDFPEVPAIGLRAATTIPEFISFLEILRNQSINSKNKILSILKPEKPLGKIKNKILSILNTVMHRKKIKTEKENEETQKLEQMISSGTVAETTRLQQEFDQISFYIDLLEKKNDYLNRFDVKIISKLTKNLERVSSKIEECSEQSIALSKRPQTTKNVQLVVLNNVNKTKLIKIHNSLSSRLNAELVEYQKLIDLVYMLEKMQNDNRGHEILSMDNFDKDSQIYKYLKFNNITVNIMLLKIKNIKREFDQIFKLSSIKSKLEKDLDKNQKEKEILTNTIRLNYQIFINESDPLKKSIYKEYLNKLEQLQIDIIKYIEELTNQLQEINKKGYKI